MINVIFENENFVVCDKPARMLSVPSRDQHDPRPCLGLLLQKKYQQSVFPSHRLDYEVSGLILFALNAKAHKISQTWFEQKTISKMYLAKTAPQDFSHWPETIPTDRRQIDVNQEKDFFWAIQIMRGKKRSFESKHGEWAETKASIIQVAPNELTWHMFPLTGKPHQLRLELSRHGFPILGDTLYGSKVTAPEIGMALKAVSLDLTQIEQRLGLPEKIVLTDHINTFPRF